jgi:hypothetical protein
MDNNIKTDFRETVCDGKDWDSSDQDPLTDSYEDGKQISGCITVAEFLD